MNNLLTCMVNCQRFLNVNSKNMLICGTYVATVSTMYILLIRKELKNTGKESDKDMKKKYKDRDKDKNKEDKKVEE